MASVNMYPAVWSGYPNQIPSPYMAPSNTNGYWMPGNSQSNGGGGFDPFMMFMMFSLMQNQLDLSMLLQHLLGNQGHCGQGGHGWGAPPGGGGSGGWGTPPGGCGPGSGWWGAPPGGHGSGYGPASGPYSAYYRDLYQEALDGAKQPELVEELHEMYTKYEKNEKMLYHREAALDQRKAELEDLMNKENKTPQDEQRIIDLQREVNELQHEVDNIRSGQEDLKGEILKLSEALSLFKGAPSDWIDYIRSDIENDKWE